jgi:hypothetical protein
MGACWEIWADRLFWNSVLFAEEKKKYGVLNSLGQPWCYNGFPGAPKSGNSQSDTLRGLIWECPSESCQKNRKITWSL